MILNYDDIVVKKSLLLTEGYIKCDNTGLICIVGKNGTGKTLLLQNIYYNCVKNGMNVKMVDQKNFEILQNLTIKENILMEATEFDECDIPWTQENIDKILLRNPKKLSGGEKRIISLLRVLASEADILLIDEPTNDLDYQNVNLLINILKEMKTNRLFVIISHDDRIKRIADQQYVTREKKLECIYNNSKDCFADKNEYTYSGSVSDNVLNKIFEKSRLCIAPLFLIVLAIITTTMDLISKTTNTIPEIESNRIDIYIPIISTFNMQNIGAVPVYVADLIGGNKNVFSLLSFDDVMSECDNEYEVQFDFNLVNTINYDLYPMEYYNISEKSTIYTLQKYIESGLGKSIEEYYVDTEEVFEYSTPMSDPSYMTPIKFDRQIFDNIINEINLLDGKDKQNVVHTIIILKNGYDFYDFIHENNFSELNESSLYIRSNETIKTMNLLNEFRELKSNITIIAVAFVIAIIMEILLIYIYLLHNEYQIYILRNYGINQQDISKFLYRKINNNILKILTWILCAVSLIYISVLYGQSSVIQIITMMLFLMEILMMRKMTQKIINGFCTKIFDWRYR